LDNQRNLIVAVVLSLALVFGFDFVMSKFYPHQPPAAPAAPAVTAPANAPAGSTARHTPRTLGLRFRLYSQ
jgi:hypothetical protein